MEKIPLGISQRVCWYQSCSLAVEYRYNAKSTVQSSKQMGFHSTANFTEYLHAHVIKKEKKSLLLYFYQCKYLL